LMFVAILLVLAAQMLFEAFHVKAVSGPV
jgi:hypothetical protein